MDVFGGDGVYAMPVMLRCVGKTSFHIGRMRLKIRNGDDHAKFNDMQVFVPVSMNVASAPDRSNTL